jgi:predicted nucleotidyltransferase
MNKEKIIKDFKKNIKNIFKDNYIFSFIGGSIAKNKITNKSDIDIFICIKSKRVQQQKIFIKWYLDFHKKNKLLPDKKFSGEITNINNLDKKLTLTLKTTPKLIISNKDVYDGLVWAGMLFGPNIAFIGNKKIYLERKKIAKKIISLWIKKITNKPQQTKGDDLLKKIIKPTKSLL